MRSMLRFTKRAALLGLLPILLMLNGCGHEDHVNIFHATFTVDGVAKDFTTDIGFFQLLNSYDIAYSQGGVQNPNANTLQISLPTDVHTGIYHETDGHVLVLYTDATGKHYRSDDSGGGAKLTLTVTAWPGRGGYAYGTFSATLGDNEGHAVAIANGKFEGWIVN